MQTKIVPVVIAIIVNSKGEYLMTQRSDIDPEDRDLAKNGLPWQFPGGGMEYGESPEESILREVREETGLSVKILGLLPKVLSDARHNWQGVFLTYMCRLVDENQKVVINEEACAFQWVTTDKGKKLWCLPKTDLMLDEADLFIKQYDNKK